jgi:cytochrome c6
MHHQENRAAYFVLPLLVVCLLQVLPLRAQNDAASLYKAKCAACHGADGSGNTPAGKALKVRDFRDPEVEKETDSELIEITTKGKNKMPAFGSALKDSQIRALVTYIRDLAKK